MHDIRLIRNDPDAFAKALKRRGIDPDISSILASDTTRRSLITSLDEMRARRNAVSKQIGEVKRTGGDASAEQEQMRLLGDEIAAAEAEIARIEEQIRQALLTLPNLPDPDTPDGSDASANLQAAVWGEPPRFDFEPLDHLEIAERLGILDFERGGKVAGSGFPVWVGAGAALERALINFMLDCQTKEHGYREMMTPFMANYASMLGSGQIPHLEADMYRTPRSQKSESPQDDLFLIPTSEVTLVNLHRDEIIPESELPIKYTAYSPCFRREAGSYGRETRGFLRVHQFNKVELVRFELPENSAAALEELRSHAEAVLRRLDLHYRVLRLCAGDMGFQSAATYDLEAWSPALKGWLEVSSCSNCRDFQARRANIRYRPSGSGKVDYLHTLNGSGLATSRLMVALLESYQTEEGSIAIPEALRPYLDGKTVITKDG